MYPTRAEAEALLRESEPLNPGPWGNHSRTAAHCAEAIARRCGLDADKAYVLGLLHDIGRRFGVTGLRHVYDGWQYLLGFGWDEAARVCLTHSFTTQHLEDYIGKFDVTDAQLDELRTALSAAVYDDYDRLIQLCDAISGADGVVEMEARRADVKRRYGSYPQEKWESNLALRRYFEQKCGQDLYIVTDRAHYRPAAAPRALHHCGTQPIETERLLLRRLLPADAEQMYQNWACDPAVTKYLRWEPHKSVAETRALLSAWAELYPNPDYYQWAIVEKASGTVFGSISVETSLTDKAHRADWPEFDTSAGVWEPGYCIGKAWWGRGYMTEALRAVVEYWFTNTGGTWLACCHAKQNPASGAVMRKAGFVYHHDSIYHKFDGTPVECRCYVLTAPLLR